MSIDLKNQIDQYNNLYQQYHSISAQLNSQFETLAKQDSSTIFPFADLSWPHLLEMYFEQ